MSIRKKILAISIEVGACIRDNYPAFYAYDG